MPNELISSEIGSEWQTLFVHPQLIEYVGICVMSFAHESELGGSNVYLPIVKKLSGNFSLNSARARALGLPLEFFQDFSLKKIRGSVGQIIYREYLGA